MPNKKRQSDGDVPHASKKTKTAKKRIPVDEGYSGEVHATVWCDEDGVAYDASLNQTNVKQNNNKFYRVQLLRLSGTKFVTHTRWGRVGEHGQTKMYPGGLIQCVIEFKKRFKDKTGLPWESRMEDPKSGKYTLLDIHYDDSESQEVSPYTNHQENRACSPVKSGKISPATADLLELIFNEQYFEKSLDRLGYDHEKLPLGQLGQTTIKKAYDTLNRLADAINEPIDQENEELINELTSKYYTLIPHALGRAKIQPITTGHEIEQENCLLDALSNMAVTSEIMSNTSKDTNGGLLMERRLRDLQMDELTALDHGSSEFAKLQDYLVNTAGHTHCIDYDLVDIFRISRASEAARLQEFQNTHPTHRHQRLLWHGSRTANFGGILKQGLRIAPPEAPVNGYMFGKGVYLADISSKSANYCCHEESDGTGLLLLAEAELGSPMYVTTQANYDAPEDSAEAGAIATFGIGQTAPTAWKDAGDVHKSLKGVLMPDTSTPPQDQTEHPGAMLQYNEFIVYNEAQVRLRYLFRVKMAEDGDW